MTQAPTPGPLSVGDYAVRLEDHPLVRAGEVHRVTEMFRGGYLGFARPVGGEWNPSGWGKCDAEGWIPWSGGENPVPGQRVQWRTRNNSERVMSVLSNNLDWTHECRRGFDPIIAFRLAPTAPVEASGSERTVPICHEIPLSNHMKVTLEYDPNGFRTAVLWNEANEPIADGDAPELAALRPQPSGETREGYVNAFYEIAEMLGMGAQAASPSEVWAREMRPRLEALIRPTPVASGGQHSSGECVHDGYEVDTAGQPLRCAECGAILSTAPVAETAREGVGEALGCEFRKTATIRAVQWHKMGDHPAVVLKSAQNRYADEGVPWCPTLEGGHVVTPGDWIATGVQGEHWPIKPNVFAATYEAVVDDGSLSQPVSPLTAGLHPKTAHLVNAFAISLAHKLLSAERKYGYSDGWLTDDWEAKCKADLLEHVQKGDPLDVAAYAAFCWARNWSTTPPVPAQDDDKLRIAVEALEKIEKDYDEYSANGTEHDAGFEKGLAAAAYRAAEALAALKSTAAQEGG